MQYFIAKVTKFFRWNIRDIHVQRYQNWECTLHIIISALQTEVKVYFVNVYAYISIDKIRPRLCYANWNSTFFKYGRKYEKYPCSHNSNTAEMVMPIPSSRNADMNCANANGFEDVRRRLRGSQAPVNQNRCMRSKSPFSLKWLKNEPDL